MPDDFYEDDEDAATVHATFEAAAKNRAVGTTIERTFPADPSTDQPRDQLVEEAARQIQRLARGIQRFAEEMRAQGIHVGIGKPPRCVCGSNSWPCEAPK